MASIVRLLRGRMRTVYRSAKTPATLRPFFVRFGSTGNCCLSAQYRRLATRRGKQRALVALGHSILVSAYYILSRRVPYRELGPLYFDSLDRQRVQQRLVQRLERLGYSVNLQPVAA